MSRIDRLVMLRIGGHVLATIAVFLGIIGLVESLDGWRLTWLTSQQGQLAAWGAVAGSAARWSIKVLPVTVLIGAIIALVDLQARRELVVIKASGISVWRVLRGPALMIVVGGLFVGVFVDSRVAELNRSFLPVPRMDTATIGGPDHVWLEQKTGDIAYVIHALRGGGDVFALTGMTFFLPAGHQVSRIRAETGRLMAGEWRLEGVTLVSPSRADQRIDTYNVPTTSTPAELELRLKATDDFTFFELRQALGAGISDPVARAAAAMRYAKLLALPALLVGSLLIAFAFTAGYRRDNSYGGTIVYGIVLGFIVFVVTEMADRAGSAGVLDPTFAAWGPAIVAIVAGLSVLLYKEDGRA